jgi:hypothetical protein
LQKAQEHKEISSNKKKVNAKVIDDKSVEDKIKCKDFCIKQIFE